jgi:hypothetical protein
LALLAGASLALAACGGPRVARKGVPGTRVNRMHGAVRLEAEYDRNKSDVGGSTQSRLLREEIEAIIEGQVYDSRFLKYAGGLTLRFVQDDTSGGDDGFSNAWSPRYFARLRFFPRHPVSLTVHAKRDEDRSIVESESSTGIVESIQEEIGSLLTFRRGRLTGEAEVRRAQAETDGLTRDRDQTSDLARLGLSHRPSAGFHTSGFYSYDRYQEQTSGQDYETNTFNVNNTIRWGGAEAGRRHTLSSIFWSRERRGTTDYTDRRLNEALRVWWLDYLDSETRYEYQWFEADNQSRRDTVRHEFHLQVYQSMFVNLGAYFSHLGLTEGETRQRGWNLGLDYRKQTPIGMLTLGYTHLFRREDNSFEDTVLQILDESHVLAATEIALLDQTDVDETTVVVTNASGTVTYVEGFDYDLIPRGRRLEVVRVPGGLIAEGEAVLVDYEYAVPGSGKFDTEDDRYRASILLFKSLRLYAELARVRQSIVSGEADRPLEDVDSWLAGLDYTVGGFTFEGEYQDYDSTAAPFTSTRLEASYARAVGPRAQLGVSATDVRTEFPDQPRIRTTTFAARYRARPTRHLSLLFQPGYRIERGRGFDRDVFELQADVRYVFGKFRVYWTLRHETLDLDTNDSDQTYTKITLERRW